MFVLISMLWVAFNLLLSAYTLKKSFDVLVNINHLVLYRRVQLCFTEIVFFPWLSLVREKRIRGQNSAGPY